MRIATNVVQWASIQRNVLLNEFSIREIVEASITPAIRERDELKAETERLRAERQRIVAIIECHPAYLEQTILEMQEREDGLRPAGAINAALTEERDRLRTERAEQNIENERMRKALERIERWKGEFPDTGMTGDDGAPMSYSACFGSNGERDFMREIARAALAKPE